jgi:hypothetical protein
MSAEDAVRVVLGKIDAAWRLKQFEGLDDCFHERAVIVGPGYAVYGSGREKCAESYREFAMNAQVLSYSESSHALRIWDSTAVYTFAWEMTYERDSGPKTESGTDQFVLELTPAGWQVVWRYIQFQPST